MSGTHEDRSYPPAGRARRIALAAPALAMTLASLDQNIMAPALPVISERFGGATTLAWVAAAFMLAATATMPIHGRLSDRYGRRRVLAWAIAAFVAASLGAALARTDVELIIARAAQGVGAGGLIVLAQALIADIIPPPERGRYQALFVTIFAICSLLGPFLGGVLTDNLSWQWIFLINLPLGAIALAALAGGGAFEPIRRSTSVDIGGALSFLVATSSSLGLLELATHAPRSHSLPIIALAGVCLLAGSHFLRREQTGQPLFPPEVIGNANVRPTLAIMLLLGAAMFSAGVFLPAYLQTDRGMSASASGLLLLPTTFGLMLGARAAGRKPGSRLLRRSKFGLGVALAGCIAAAVAVFEVTPVVTLAAAFFLLGCGVGLAQPALVAHLQNSVDSKEIGIATATATFGRSLGGTFGIAVAGVISSGMAGSAVARAIPALSVILGGSAICYMVALMITFTQFEP